MNLENAIAAHAEWKIKLRSAINKREKLDDVTLSADDKCPLGQWLHGEARTRYGGTGSYSACVAKHADFHRCLAGIAAAVNSGNYAEAEAMLSGGTPYSNASNAVATAIVALREEAGLT